MEPKAQDLMSHHDLVTVKPRTSLRDLDRVLFENQISGVPVVNDSGEVIGVVSQTDIVRFLYRELDQSLNFFSYLDTPKKIQGHTVDEEMRSSEVWEIMQTRLHSVSPDTGLSTIARTMRRHRIHRVLVMDGKRLVGLISSFDMIRVVENPEWLRKLWDGERGSNAVSGAPPEASAAI